MKRFECRIGDGEWWVMNEEFLSASNAAYRFAKMMIDREWRTYDLAHAKKLCQESVEVRYGEDGEIYRYDILGLRLCIDVEVKHAE